MFAALGASPASAHNTLVESNPKDGAVLSAVPVEWSLTFENDVPLDSATAEVVAQSGVRTQLPTPRHGASQKEILFSLPQNLTGAVTARWRLVGTDGHVVSARISFTVGEAVATTVPAGGSPGDTATAGGPTTVTEIAADDSTTPEPARFALRLIGFAAIVALGGVFATAALGGGVVSAPGLRRLVVGSATAAFVVPAVQTLVFLDDVSGNGLLGSIGSVFQAFDTTPGSMLVLRAVIGGLIAYLVWRGIDLASRALLLLSLMYLFALSYAGHSRSMAWPVIGVPADVVHTAGIAAWLGGLVVLAVFVVPGQSAHEALDSFRRYGELARYAVAAIVVTGVVQTLRLHGTIVTLFTESHGRWLLAKLVVVAGMLKVADINRRRVERRLPDHPMVIERHVALIRRASLTEIGLGALVMSITSVLVTASFG